MSTLQPIPPPTAVTLPEAPVVATGPTFTCQTQTKHICRDWPLKPSEAFVRGVEKLFAAILGTPVDRNKPLTEEQVRTQVICSVHARGIPTFPVLKTLGLMNRWREELSRKKRIQNQRALDKELRLAGGARPSAPAKNYGTYIPKVVGKKKNPDGKKKGKSKKKGR